MAKTQPGWAPCERDKWEERWSYRTDENPLLCSRQIQLFSLYSLYSTRMDWEDSGRTKSGLLRLAGGGEGGVCHQNIHAFSKARQRARHQSSGPETVVTLDQRRLTDTHAGRTLWLHDYVFNPTLATVGLLASFMHEQSSALCTILRELVQRQKVQTI